MPSLLADLKFALRLLARQPGFTATAVLVLAIGIGANAAVFSVVDTFLLKPLPAVRDGGRILSLYGKDTRNAGNYRGFSYPNYVDIRRGTRALQGVGALTIALTGVTESGVTRRTFVQMVSANYFDVLGTAPVWGRAFSLEEERPGREALVAVASYGFWQRHATDPAVVGAGVILNGRLFTIVGVAPPGFRGTTAGGPATEFWVPLSATGVVENDFLRGIAGGDLASRDTHKFLLFGRMKDGVSAEAVGEDLAGLGARLAEAYPAANRDFTIAAGPLARFGFAPVPGRNAPLVSLSAILLGMSAVVLLVACLNLANMLLARGAARRKEIAVRLSVGAPRLAIVRQLLVEGLLLSLAGAAVGLVAGRWAMALLMRSVAPMMTMPVDLDMALDARMTAAAVAFAAAATIAFALGPALKVTRPGVVEELKEQAGEDVGRRARLFGARNLLLGGQMALSLALLVTGALFVRGALKAAAATPGFPIDRGVIVEVDPSLGGYSRNQSADAHRRAMTRLRGLPGVDAASMASIVPFGPVSEQVRVARPGPEGTRPDATAQAAGVAAEHVSIGGDYFHALGLGVLRGRTFTAEEAEGRDAVRAAVIDEPAARRLFPKEGEDPVGQLILVGSRGDGQQEQVLQVVGLVPGVRANLFDRAPVPHVYVPFSSRPQFWMFYHVRLARGVWGDEAMVASLRREVAAVDPRLPVLSVRTLPSFVRESVFLWIFRSGARVFTALGLAALVLALVGLYGVNAHMVLRRTREIGIRMALGASARDVVRLVVRESAIVTAAGLVAGIGLALAIGRVLGWMLFEVSPFDPIALAVAPLLLAASALVASYLPARRAARLGIVSALRRE